MNGRRFRLIAILAPLVALALGSFWLFEVMRRASDEVIPTPERKEPDFYVEKFSYVKMTKSGKAQYHFSGTRMTHNPQDDSYDIELPVVKNLRGANGPMTLRAKRATVNSDNSQIHMYENVRMDRPATADSEAMRLLSDYLLVLPDDDVVKSDKPVEIHLGQSVLTGTGMFANNATRELRLAGNVHGTYQAPQR
ncbi:LPS export ABC transporter periplasmic protein LptC [Noviherbaspirillum saxi]|uniref:LPS export ABC transporter periplasmic protein LptC n=1 Tax=Noviherbaspirillum saxi TaxID=2320863 RepID=A0A3A3FWJ0_9BURK|nr:LPS export ABC transporter periplasmic protein LptC [Noviherbaspirillum saxi]RJF99694.1 LPS export ABC transporter periplasmic protein LptC [Noviherbaspirillum saxi]